MLRFPLLFSYFASLLRFRVVLISILRFDLATQVLRSSVCFDCASILGFGPVKLVIYISDSKLGSLDVYVICFIYVSSLKNSFHMVLQFCDFQVLFEIFSL